MKVSFHGLYKLVIQSFPNSQHVLLLKRSKISCCRYRIFCSQCSDTIFALSSGHEKCGVAVIRVSGPRSESSLKALCRTEKLPKPRFTHLRKLFNPVTLEPIDKGLVIWFPGPDSFTGEDCTEYHVHGGQAVITEMANVLGGLDGFRHAEAGEFTKRAFTNGKLDLTEVEGLGDLIHAETEAQRKQALRQMDGELSRMYTTWRKQIISYTASVEAYIDFAEEDNIEDDVLNQVNIGIEQLLSELESHLRDNRQGEILRSGVQVAIVGEPNVGKSSLLNSVCQRPAAIVSPLAGTTRDVVETGVNIGGYPVLLSDTAGLRETQDSIEKEGVRRALHRAQQADIKVLMMDCDLNQNAKKELSSFILQRITDLGIALTSDVEGQTGNCSTKENDSTELKNIFENYVLVFNKMDKLSKEEVIKLQTVTDLCDITSCIISCESGEGLDDFVTLLKEKVAKICGNPLAGSPSLTQTRHRQHLQACVSHLHQYQKQPEDVVIAAFSLQNAAREIGKITGKITSEDILDVIFRDFCIGK
ncbi:tRNA modification GTPase GTPBP3, mitochondrial-like [Mizuhopecten yessoensis]|uniref:tRNA modification GTPase GTPBP3, mitochondrial n=1 Tax=Mizuhopecten yessoensis TaxID=6573 RepID=A0A210QZ91_MIZYE|nr:tRNA modification GTPase GTPBP3, mitochondrial-like [Mizuhopecten yessoensis]OWF53951.1 tRNA modification GTPase GTPBP3, mitochondrial [Mizuhopecten yessoensis]